MEPRQAEEFISKWFDVFPAIRHWKEEVESSRGESGSLGPRALRLKILLAP